MKKYHIYIHTPFHDNSKFIPHFIEHIIFRSEIGEYYDFLKNRDVLGKNKSFITEYVFSGNEVELNNLVDRIKTFPSNEIIKDEYKVIKDELSEKSYYSLLYEKIGKKLISPKFSNNKIEKLNISKIKAYHEKYYKNGKIIILENGKIEKEDNVSGYIKNDYFIDIKGFKQKILINKMNIFNLFYMYFLGELYNDYIEYNTRILKNNYYEDDITYYFYDDYVCLSIPNNLSPTIEKIEEDFKKSWIKYYVNKISTNYDDYLNFLDGVAMIRFGYTLSLKTKMELIFKI